MERKQKQSNRRIKDPIVWIDLEMTGLDTNKDRIIEIAVIVTGPDLRKRKGPDLVIKCPKKVLDGMGEWCMNTFTASGLLERVKASRISMRDAETRVLSFLRDECGIEKFTAPLAGNSITTDKMFLKKDMPRLYEFLHYRIIDVTSIGILCKWWYPKEFEKRPKKKGNHRAMDDIVESIDELKFYRDAVFKKKRAQIRH